MSVDTNKAPARPTVPAPEAPPPAVSPTPFVSPAPVVSPITSPFMGPAPVVSPITSPFMGPIGAFPPECPLLRSPCLAPGMSPVPYGGCPGAMPFGGFGPCPGMAPCPGMSPYAGAPCYGMPGAMPGEMPGFAPYTGGGMGMPVVCPRCGYVMRGGMAPCPGPAGLSTPPDDD